jgi:hypothetical protein
MMILCIGEMKELVLKDKFDKLERQGKLESFIQKKQEDNDKKRF